MSASVIDLTAEMYDRAPTMPMDPKMSITEHCTLDTLGYNLARLTCSTHQGTHLDVPYHFFNEGFTLSELDLNRVVTRAVKIDLTYKKPHQAIYVSDVETYLPQILAGCSIILHTGWDKVFPAPAFFTDFPYVSCELADWFSENSVNLVGMDMPTPNGAQWKYVHEKLLGNSVLILEGLVNLELLPDDEFVLIALPLRLRKRDGSPVRAVGIVNNEPYAFI